MNWATSDRRARLPSNWSTIVAATKRKARGRCQAATHVPECNGIGTDCDHIKRGDDHSPDNLQWLSHECHKAKTTADRTAHLRPPEQHPGRI